MPSPSWSPVVELRRYTLHPGKRDVLIDLFERTFIEPQEQARMKVIGQFREFDDPDKFTWLRGFPDMPERARSLAEFYGGPVWQANRNAANGTMVDSDDVLLLRPARPSSAFTLSADRPPPGTAGASPERGVVAAIILPLEARAEEAEVLSHFEREIVQAVTEGGGSILAYFVTNPSENTFPVLPVREGEHVFVWFSGFADRQTLARGMGDDAVAMESVLRAPGLKRPPQILRLTPTPRSLLTGSSPACVMPLQT